jgi:hypothetical protein
VRVSRSAPSPPATACRAQTYTPPLGQGLQHQRRQEGGTHGDKLWVNSHNQGGGTRRGIRRGTRSGTHEGAPWLDSHHHGFHTQGDAAAAIATATSHWAAGQMTAAHWIADASSAPHSQSATAVAADVEASASLPLAPAPCVFQRKHAHVTTHASTFSRAAHLGRVLYKGVRFQG